MSSLASHGAGLALLLSLIVAVAVFNIVATLVMTVTDKRTSGRTSAARSPSAAATRIVSWLAARLTITWLTRGSSDRA